MTATQEFVNSRVYPIESQVQGILQTLDEKKIREREIDEQFEEVKNKLSVRDADFQSTERRVEEVAQLVKKLQEEFQKLKDGTAAGYTDPDSRKSRGIMGNPALRNLEAYSGDHAKYNKWRSKIKGILTAEDDTYRKALKMIESHHQNEIPSIADDPDEHQAQLDKFAKEMDVDKKVVLNTSQQLRGCLPVTRRKPLCP